MWTHTLDVPMTGSGTGQAYTIQFQEDLWAAVTGTFVADVQIQTTPLTSPGSDGWITDDTLTTVGKTKVMGALQIRVVVANYVSGQPVVTLVGSGEEP